MKSKKPYVIPEWMKKTLKDDSLLGIEDVLKIAGRNTSDKTNLPALVKNGLLPPPNRKATRDGKRPVNKWSFKYLKEWVEKHNSSLSDTH